MSTESDNEKQAEALALFRQANEHQMKGEFEEAIELYKKSIAMFPTAESHTFLGWTYSFQGKWEEAIQECLKAIEVDPTFGNPYNDIGAYLVEQKRLDEAIPWFERALQAPRYENYCFPHYNLGRVYMAKEQFGKARQHFEQALKLCPDYELAKEALEKLRRKLQ